MEDPTADALDGKGSGNHISPRTAGFSEHGKCPNGLAAGPRSLQVLRISPHLDFYQKRIGSALKQITDFARDLGGHLIQSF